MRTNLPAGLLLLTLVACGPGATPRAGTTPSETPTTESPTPSPTTASPTSTRTPEPTGSVSITVATRRGGSGAFASTVEQPSLTGLGDAAAAKAKAGIAAFLDGWVAAAKAEQAKEPRQSVTYDVTTTLTAYDTTYATVEFFSAYYPDGMAHPRNDLATYVVDRADGSRLDLADFVKPGSLPAALRTISTVARRRLPEILGLPLGDMMRKGTEPDAGKFARVTPLPEGLQVAFGSYEVAPYSSGFPRLVVPWESFATVLALPLPDGLRNPPYRDGDLASRDTYAEIVTAIGKADGMTLRPDEYRVERAQLSQYIDRRGDNWAMALVVPVGAAAANNAVSVVALRKETYDTPWRVIDSGTSGTGCTTLREAVRVSLAVACD